MEILVSSLAASLPDWSKTASPVYHVEYSGLKTVAVKFLTRSERERRLEIEAYSKEWCFPTFNIEKASGLYVLLRLVFELPTKFPKGDAKVFGSWLHPSIGEENPTFNLSWPVRVDPEKRVFTIERCRGYAGRPYKALDEYDYFMKNFPLRSKDVIQSYAVE